MYAACNNRLTQGFLCLLVTGLLLTTATKADDSSAEKLPRVLILGDSISIGYTPFVREMLDGEAIVVRPMRNEKAAENCAGTTYGRQRIDEWLKIDGGDFDVIHFNWGLHDLKRVEAGTGRNSNNPEDPRQAEPDAYRKQLAEIVDKLVATDAQLILCTTTPVPDGGVKPHRDPADVQRYNLIAKEVVKPHRIQIDDLYTATNDRLSEIQRPVNVHFTPDGSKFLARHVAASIRLALEKKK